MFYSSCGNREGLENLAEMAFVKGKFNIAFQCYFMTSEAEKCYDVLMKSGKVSECVYFARAYIPSKLPQAMTEWKAFMKEHRPTYSP